LFNFFSTVPFWFNALLGFGGFGKICVSLRQYCCLLSSACYSPNSRSRRTAWRPRERELVEACQLPSWGVHQHRPSSGRSEAEEEEGRALCTTKNMTSNLRKRLCCTFAKRWDFYFSCARRLRVRGHSQSFSSAASTSYLDLWKKLAASVSWAGILFFR
jgi:hypothetical protein